MRLETRRLELRSAIPADAVHLYALFSNPEVLRYLPPGPPMTLEQVVERRMQRETELGYAPSIIRLKGTGEFIGSGGLNPVKDTSYIEIAYHFLPSAWGNGYATETAMVILDFAFRKVKLEEVIGLAFAENVPSCKVMEKAGMRYVGLASYHGIDDLRKYVANRERWTREVHDSP